MFEDLPRVRSERRIVILISDGLDNASRTKPGAVIDAALNNRVSFYVIHLPLFEPRDGRLAVRAPAKGFRDLAEKTGGKYFLAGDVKVGAGPGEGHRSNERSFRQSKMILRASIYSAFISAKGPMMAESIGSRSACHRASSIKLDGWVIRANMSSSFTGREKH